MKYNQYLKNKTLNEADTVADGLLTFFKDMKSYTVRMTQYPALYQEKCEAELNNVVQQAKFAKSSSEKQLDLEEKAKESITAKVNKMPREKRAAARAQMEERISQQKEKIKEQITLKKTALEERGKAAVAEIATEITELTKENPVESTFMSKSLDKMEIETALDLDEVYGEKKLEAKFAIIEISDEQQEKQRQRASKAAAKEKSDKQARLGDLEAEATAAEAELDKKIAGSDEKSKETLNNMKVIQGEFKKFLTLGKDITDMKNNESFDINIDFLVKSITEETEINEADDDEKLKLKKKELSTVRKKITEITGKLSATKIAKALGASSEEGEGIYTGITDQWNEIKDQYKELRDVVTSDDDELTDPPEELTDDGGKKASSTDDGGKKAAVKTELTPEEKTSKINNLSAKLNDPKISDENKNKIRERIKELEDNNSETFDSEYLAISEDIDNLLSATSKKIMTFSDFLANR